MLATAFRRKQTESRMNACVNSRFSNFHFNIRCMDVAFRLCLRRCRLRNCRLAWPYVISIRPTRAAHSSGTRAHCTAVADGSTPNLQTIQERHKALLQKAQEELEGNTSNKLSLKATLTDQIKEQENTLAAVKEVKSDRLVLFKQNFLQN